MIILLGLLLIAGGIYLLRQARQLAAKHEAHLAVAVTASGAVVGMDQRVTTVQPATRRSVVMSHPVVEFMTADGRQVEATSLVGTQPAMHRIGDQVTVRYDPQDPSKIVIEGLSGNPAVPATITKVIAILLLIGGGIVTLVGVAVAALS